MTAPLIDSFKTNSEGGWGRALNLGNNLLDNQPLAPGSERDHVMTVKAVDKAGNETTAASFTITIDVTPPSIVLTSPDNQISFDPVRFITGTMTDLHAGTQVDIYSLSSLGDELLATTTVDGSGNFSATITLTDNTGATSVYATAMDRAGNKGVSGGLYHDWDNTAPVVVFDTVVRDVPLPTLTNVATHTFVVTAYDHTIGTTIYLYDNGGATPIASSTARFFDAWTFENVTLVGDGPHVLVAKTTDLGGNTGSSTPFTMVLDTTPPVPTVTSLTALTNNPSPSITLTGTAEAGMELRLIDLSRLVTPGDPDLGIPPVYSGDIEIGRVTAGPDGSWSLDVAFSGEGTHNIVARGFDAAGNASTDSPFAFTIDTAPPAVTINGLATPTNQLNQTITGTGETGANIQVFDGATLLGSTTVVAGGWSLGVTLDNVQGAHALTARATDAATNFTITAPVTYTVDTIAPVVNLTPGQGGLTRFQWQNITGVGEVGTRIQIYDGADPIGDSFVITDADGSWSDEVRMSGDGTHLITARDTDAATNVGISGIANFTLDTTRPNLQVSFADGATTSRVQIISGTVDAEDAGRVVTVTVDSRVMGTAVVGVTGAWSLRIDLPQLGLQVLEASLTDLAGNFSGNEANLTYTALPVPAPLLGVSTILADTILSDFDFAGISGLTKLVFAGDGRNDVTLGATAAAVFGAAPMQIVANASVA
ncbi:MAG: Ig-like domain-containing protein [Roseococcus sp.]